MMDPRRPFIEGIIMKIEVFRRTDNRWAFRVRAANGQVMATDGGQGYENMQDAIDTVTQVTGYRTRTDEAIAFEVQGRAI